MIQRAKHTVINISIVEFDPAPDPRGQAARDLSQDTKFTVRADNTNQAIEKAMKRLRRFVDDGD
jgi:hypothetical protein